MYLHTDPDEHLWRAQDTPHIERMLHMLITMHEFLHTPMPAVETRIEMLQYLLFERLETKTTIQ